MNGKKIRIKAMTLLGLILCVSLVSAATLQVPITQKKDVGDTKITSYQNVYSKLFDLFNKNFLNFMFIPGLTWKFLDKGLNTYELSSFSSNEELAVFLKDKCGSSTGGWYLECDMATPSVTFASKSSRALTGTSNDVSHYSGSVDFSQTNIQVEGVDEPDTVKTDGTYLYILANSKIYIIKAYPAEDAGVLSEITLDTNSYSSNIFINNDRLIVFGTSSRTPDNAEEDDYSWWGGITTTQIKIYDISDRENPTLLDEMNFDGRYVDARMIGNYVYLVTNEYTGNIYRIENNEIILNIPEVTINGNIKKIGCNQIYYVDIPERIDAMTNVISIDLNDNEVSQKSFLLGSSQTMYVSEHNIFLTYTKYDYIEPVDGERYGRSEEKTIIHKISVHDGGISYTAQGEVPGRILNQFSMDEYDGFFRIATTVGNVWDHEQKSSNNIYILDENLELISSIENIAPGERIYSSRFMGGKAYLVTFKKVDPFFTLDLSDPYNPKILGKLKIPGYSDYLHPYDENHIIGIGKDTVEALDSSKESRGIDFAWYQGLKIALFDVSDFENPIELSKIIIGDRGTDSPALQDHKAFLFDRAKELLVLPVNLYEISDDIKQQNNGYTGSTHGEFKFQGAYVYKLSLEDGFELKGRVTHMDDEEALKTGYWYGGSSSVTRSLYIGDILYTLSNSMVKMNNLDTLEEINSVDLI